MPNTSEPLRNLFAINNEMSANTPPRQEQYYHYHYSSNYNQAGPSYRQVNDVGYNSNYYAQNNSYSTQYEYNYPYSVPYVQNNNYRRPQNISVNNTPPIPFAQQYYPNGHN